MDATLKAVHTAVAASPWLSISSKSPDDHDFDSSSEIPLEKASNILVSRP
jgi:hypothetical protein